MICLSLTTILCFQSENDKFARSAKKNRCNYDVSNALQLTSRNSNCLFVEWHMEIKCVCSRVAGSCWNTYRIRSHPSQPLNIQKYVCFEFRIKIVFAFNLFFVSSFSHKLFSRFDNWDKKILKGGYKPFPFNEHLRHYTWFHRWRTACHLLRVVCEFLCCSVVRNVF